MTALASCKRLAAISRAMDELARCRRYHCIGAQIGELDWLWELHLLLHHYEER